MAESKFTPGPWGVQDGVHRDGGLGYRIIGPAGFVVGFTQAALSREDYFGFARANAELMADAPALLNALRALCECTIADPEDDRDSTRRVFADAERLLEKHGG